jgi:D-alanyl-D-alanine carboxypeptidase
MPERHGVGEAAGEATMVRRRRRTLDIATTALAVMAVTVVSGGVFVAAAAEEATADLPGRLQQALERYLADRRAAEKITGLAAYVSLGDPGPGVEVFAGTRSRDDDSPIDGATLFQIGSNTKAFTAVLLLELEAEGKLTVDQTVGDWLPLYPAWKDVTIRRLLHMTSGMPNYTEAPRLSRAIGCDPDRHWTNEDLVDFVYPTEDNQLPANSGWFYSNTNYVLAGMIVEQASGMSYGAALREYIFEPVGLFDTYYEPMAYPTSVTERMASGYLYNAECELYAPDCTESGLAPLIGRDLKTADVSWAGPAGGIVSSPHDLARWVRAVFAGRVLSQEQLDQMLTLVSTKTGEPIEEVDESDPRGFGLGVVRMLRPELGRFWFYEGETLGYRAVFGWFPEDDLVITIATNSQPPPDDDHIGQLLAGLREVTTASGGGQ